MRELNWKAGQTVELSTLGEAPAAGAVLRPARILELSGKRAHLAMDFASKPLPAGTAVRLEWDGQLLLGEVQQVEPSGCWMEIHHMLLDTAGLGWQKNGWQRG